MAHPVSQYMGVTPPPELSWWPEVIRSQFVEVFAILTSSMEDW